MRRNALFFCLITFLFAACLSRHDTVHRPGHVGKRKPQHRTATVKRTTKPESSRTSVSGNEYINRYKDIAIAEMNQYGIPASIKLAQAILESGNGNSVLARESNNHFGIKCASGWQGKRTYHKDDNPNDCFRVYANPAESFRDHSEFLMRQRYAKLFELDKNDYKGWARGLKAAGYATNPRYADLLIDLIERYELYQYDRPESNREKQKREHIVQAEIKHQAAEPANFHVVKTPVAMTIHEVKRGDTLYSIGRQYGLSAEELINLNGLKGDALTPGQLLVVSQ